MRGVLPSEQVAHALEETGRRVDQFMLELLPVAAACSYSPISNYAVGAVALGMPTSDGPGHLYLGANFEFPGQALCLAIHAEQSAVNNAWLCGEEGIRALAVSAAPCGFCRQFLNELSTAGALTIILSATGRGADACEAHPLSRLLPDAFGPRDLGVEAGLMRNENRGVRIESNDPTTLAALAACNASYAPYTKACAGFALRDAGGTIHPGRYAENAAFNPSLLAIQSAVASTRLRTGPAAPLSIVDAVLVERCAGSTSQRDLTSLILESLSPGVSLRYYSV